jgi:hypothetical protein
VPHSSSEKAKGRGSLHDVGVLLGALQREACEEVGEEWLQHRLQLHPSHALGGSILDRQEPLHTARGVSVDDTVLKDAQGVGRSELAALVASEFLTIAGQRN